MQIEEEKGDWIQTYFSGLGTSSKTLPKQNLTFTLLSELTMHIVYEVLTSRQIPPLHDRNIADTA